MSIATLRAPLAFAVVGAGVAAAGAEPLPGGSLDPTTVPKFVTPLVVPPAMPPSTSDPDVDYQIAVRQFRQQVLPPGFPETTVWSYGSIDRPGTVAEGGSFHYPAFTIEATSGEPVTVKWVNDLKDAQGRFLPHLLPVDQTLHLANPLERHNPAAATRPPYRGPVPMIVHLHGAHVGEESDGYPEAWYLPDARDLPPRIATRGARFGQIAGAPDVPGQAIFRYPNDQPATTLWYHDHTLGMTRVNVYAGPAGFYLLRGGPGDDVRVAGLPAELPGPAPGVGADPFARWFEIPIVIQDRAFNVDGSLFYPASRAFFDGFRGPVAPATDVAPIWNPEVFGNVLVTNGRSWPYLEVEPRRYRLRFLNGSNARFLILTTEGAALTFWQIGGDGGFLEEPVPRGDLLLGPAERADVIVDFSAIAPGTSIPLLNLGPDEPFGGGVPGVDFEPADPGTTGQVLELRVVEPQSVDATSDPSLLALPAPAAIGAPTVTRRLSLNEMDSEEVCLGDRGRRARCDRESSEPFGPERALLGTLDEDGYPEPVMWHDPISELPATGATEVWELYNFTADAHPMHLHLVQFEVLDRQPLEVNEEGHAEPPARLAGEARPPEPWESGRKDTLIVYPGEVARVKAHFDLAGLYVWHCHILEHEDNEMMRPFLVGP
jgi:spore coat protein A